VNNEDLIDLFAGLAMQGILANGRFDSRNVAEDSYDFAYAMIKEREKRIERERPTQGN
jgi:hypothetical protein